VRDPTHGVPATQVGVAPKWEDPRALRTSRQRLREDYRGEPVVEDSVEVAADGVERDEVLEWQVGRQVVTELRVQQKGGKYVEIGVVSPLVDEGRGREDGAGTFALSGRRQRV